MLYEFMMLCPKTAWYVEWLHATSKKSWCYMNWWDFIWRDGSYDCFKENGYNHENLSILKLSCDQKVQEYWVAWSDKEFGHGTHAVQACWDHDKGWQNEGHSIYQDGIVCCFVRLSDIEVDGWWHWSHDWIVVCLIPPEYQLPTVNERRWKGAHSPHCQSSGKGQSKTRLSHPVWWCQRCCWWHLKQVHSWLNSCSPRPAKVMRQRNSWKSWVITWWACRNGRILAPWGPLCFSLHMIKFL